MAGDFRFEGRMEPMIARVAEILLGVVFLISGGLKAWAPAQFYESIEGYQILPSVVALGLAYYLPYLEIVVGLGLVARVKALECAWIVSGLVGIFLMALASAWFRGLDVECGCFGSTSAGVGLWEPIVRDVALAGVALYVVRARLRDETNPKAENLTTEDTEGTEIEVPRQGKL
jgi:hypothetical protein